jgi:hypothetical protein
MTGTITHPANTVAINLRADGTSTWQNTIMTQSAGDEAVVFANANARTSWMFVNGEDSIAHPENNRWQSLTPALQIKGGCVAIGKLIPSGTTPTTRLDIAGSTALTGDIQLKTSGSSSDDSGGIVWYYGNGKEKMRLWSNNTYTAKSGPNFRVYKSDETLLFNGTLSLSDHTHNYAGSSSAGGAATSANKLNTNAGATDRPVYFSGGVPVQCNAPTSGSWWKGVPLIGTDGVTEIGRYIDFHTTNASTADYDYRINTTTTAMTLQATGSSNTLTINSSGNTQLSFQTTSSGKAYTASGIICYPLTTSGMTTLFSFGGNVVIGGGESAKTLYDNNYDTIKTAENETLYLASDSEEIHLITDAQTYAGRKVLKILGGQLTKSGGPWISARDNAPVHAYKGGDGTSSSFFPAIFSKSKNGGWAIGTIGNDDNFYVSYTTDAHYSSDTNTSTYTIQFPHDSGTLALTSSNITGNAASATTASKLGSSTVGSDRKPIYLNSGTATEANYMVSHFGNAGLSNMNDVGKLFASVGMTYLSDPGNTVDNPMNGTTKSTNWHLYWDACFSDDPSGSNGWVAQIANKAGSAQWWVRSRKGGTITNGTEWDAGWEHLTITSQAGAGSATNPVYVDSNGHTQACTYSLNKTVPSNAVFTDHITTVTSSGSGNAVTAVSADANGALTVTKGSTFSLSTHTHNYAGSSSAGGPALSVSTAGGDVVLGTPSASSDDSGDIVWRYGNGLEKARLWQDNTYTAKAGPPYRVYKSDGTNLYNGRLPLADGTSASGTWGISITGSAATATRANCVNVVASNEIRFYNDNQFKSNNHFWLGFSWAEGSHYTPSGGSDTSSTTAPNITKFVMGDCTRGGLTSVHAKTFILGNGSSPLLSSKTTTITTAATTTDRTITLPDDSGTVALTSKTFNVTRGSSVSTATSGYWAAMCNSSNQSGSTAVLPTSGKWWHVISMDWTGNDTNNWISQLAIATQDGSGVWWRRNNPYGTSIDSSTWHRLAEGNSSGAATNIATEVGSAAGARPVFYAYLDDNTRVVYNTNFTYNPSGNVLKASTFDGEITSAAFNNRIYALSQTPSGSTWNGNETLITSIPSSSGTSTPNYQRVKTIDFIKDCISDLKEPVLYENTTNPSTSTTIQLPNGIPKYLKVFIGVEYSSDGSTYSDSSACINCIDVDMAHTRHGGFIGYDTPGQAGVGNYLAYCYVNVKQNTGSTTAYTVGISYAKFLNLANSTTMSSIIARIVKIIAVY